MDIIFLALLSVYIFYRLWGILGSRTGEERPSDWFSSASSDIRKAKDADDQDNNVIVLPSRHSRLHNLTNDSEEPSVKRFETALNHLKAIDPKFDEDSFLRGSVRAFDKIVNAYASSNHSVLKKLLSSDVYEKFAKAIEDREKSGYRLEAEIDSIDARLEDVKVYDDRVSLIVGFKSDQMLATIDNDGKSIDNPSRLKDTVYDVWTFEKTLPLTSNIWLLTKTDSGQESL
jgi:predicted lipid-binding transport protein (Tim44 family)